MPSLTLIITTYNWVEALDRVLASVAAQGDRDFEVIVADDGSTAETAACIEAWKTRFPVLLRHCWQPDEGFRAAAVRNRAATLAQGAYLVFVDGDCILCPDFIQNHRRLAQPGYWVSGNRVLCSQAWTQKILAQRIPLFNYSAWQWVKAAFQGRINRAFFRCRLPLGVLRNGQPKRWRGAKTCNLGLWTADFKAVNGFDEAFEGWGFEDSDLVIRLINRGCYHRQGRWGGLAVIHCWHPERSRTLAGENRRRLEETRRSKRFWAPKGVVSPQN